MIVKTCRHHVAIYDCPWPECAEIWRLAVELQKKKAKEFDDKYGTPCEQIRRQQSIDDTKESSHD